MVQAYAGYDAQAGGDDIGAVKPSSEPGLDNCEVNLPVCKPAESHPGSNLEKGQPLCGLAVQKGEDFALFGHQE